MERLPLAWLMVFANRDFADLEHLPSAGIGNC